MSKIKNGIFGIGVVSTILIASGIGGHVSQAGNKAAHVLSSHASAETSNIKPAPPLPTAVSDMNQAITANSGDLQAAATLIDLDNGQEYDAGESGYVFKAASTAKIIAAVDYLHEVEQGKASLSQNIGGANVQQQLKQMIEVSDNTAWLNINNFLGNQQQQYAQSIGLKSFTGGEYNTITTSDEAKLLEKLYQGKLINSSHRALLYSYMANTDSTNLIPEALPDSATVYNKYGELEGELHDAAIVSYQGHHFVLVVYTKNSDGTDDEYDNQVTLIHAITAAAFNDVIAS